MDINKGFKIDNPNIFIPWDINVRQLKMIFEGHRLRRITNTCFETSGWTLNGLACKIAFRFGEIDGKLKEIEFSRAEYPDLRESFIDFQIHFECEFGNAHRKEKAYNGFYNYMWFFGDVLIIHYVFDESQPEERMKIRKRAKIDPFLKPFSAN